MSEFGASPRNGVVPPAEHRFKPGVSGNPTGRPIDKPYRDAYKKFSALAIEDIEALDVKKLTAVQAVAIAQLRQAMRGETIAAREIADRVDGKVTSTVKHEGGIDLGKSIAAAALAAASGEESEPVEDPAGG